MNDPLPSDLRACTCHPDDRPPVCQGLFAASECQEAYRASRKATLPSNPKVAGEYTASQADYVASLLAQIERLTRELKDTEEQLFQAVKVNIRQLIDRHNSMVDERDRLRAALEHIIDYETHDMDGNVMPESGAAYIAKEALRPADETAAAKKPRYECGYSGCTLETPVPHWHE